MSKPTFDPSKPFEAVDEVSTKQAKTKKPKFDPAKSFEVISDGLDSHQSNQDALTKDALLLGAQGASFGYLDEMAGAVSPNYETGRDYVRKEVEGARERLPYVGPVIEGAGSVATSLAVPPLRGGTFAKELGLAALQGYGENTDPDNVIKDVGFSMGTSAAANVVGKGLKNVFSPPEDILANSAGARGINYRKGESFAGAETADEFASRLKDPAGLAARLDKINFFGWGNKAFKNGKYVRNGGLTETLSSPVTLESMMERVQSGISALGDHNKQLLKGKRIPLAKLKATLDQTAMDFLPAGEDYVKREATAKQLSDNAFQDLILSGKIKPGDSAVDAAAVEELKRKWQKTVASSYDNGKALSEITNVGVEARRKFSTALDKLLDTHGGVDYAKNNDMMRDLFAVEDLIHNKGSRQRGYSMGGPRLTNMSQLWSSLVENSVAHPQADIARARIGQGMRTAVGQQITKGMSRVPMEFMNSTIDQTPEVEVIENDPGHPMNNKGRMPQSIQNIPEELIRTPLPRTTQGLMKNKPFVLAKVAQMMPEMFEAVKDVYDHNPENLGELAQVIAMKMPHVFEKDKYNRFDGRILSEVDKQKAIKDTLLNNRLSSIDQAKIITKLNKEGLYDV